MSYEQFQLALTLISQRKYQPDPRETGCAQGLIRLFEEHLFPLAHFVSPQDGALHNVATIPEVAERIEAFHASLKAIYGFYSRRAVGPMRADKHVWGLKDLHSFAEEFEVVPSFLSRMEVAQLFRALGVPLNNSAL